MATVSRLPALLVELSREFEHLEQQVHALQLDNAELRRLGPLPQEAKLHDERHQPPKFLDEGCEPQPEMTGDLPLSALAVSSNGGEPVVLPVAAKEATAWQKGSLLELAGERRSSKDSQAASSEPAAGCTVAPSRPHASMYRFTSPTGRIPETTSHLEAQETLKSHFSRLSGGQDVISVDALLQVTELGKLNLTTDELAALSRYLQASAEGSPMEQVEEGCGLGFEAFAQLLGGNCEYPKSSADYQTIGNHMDLVKAALEHEARVRQSQLSQRRRCYNILFEFAPPVVIFLNFLQIGISMDVLQGTIFWQVTEYFFFIFYATETLLKMYFFGISDYFRGREKYWNMFDLACLVITFADVCSDLVFRVMSADSTLDFNTVMGLKMLRALRLARLVRSLRFRAFHELKLMCMGVVSGLRVLFWAIVLLFLLVYCVGVIMRTFFSQHVEFRTLGAAMSTVFRCFTDGCTAYDGEPLHERMRTQHSTFFFVGYVLVYMVITVGVFNLIMAIFIDNVMISQHARKEKELHETARSAVLQIEWHVARLLALSSGDRRDAGPRVSFPTRAMIQRMVSQPHRTEEEHRAMMSLLLEEKLTVTKDTFEHWLADESFREALGKSNIEVPGGSLFDILDVDMGGHLDLNELLTGLIQLRGSVTKGDIIRMSLKVSHLTQLVEDVRGNEPKHDSL